MVKRIYKIFRVVLFQSLSTNRPIKDNSRRIGPLMLTGLGKISLGSVDFGVEEGIGFFSSYTLLDARLENDEINIGNGVKINNGFSAIAQNSSIVIGDNVLIGNSVSLFASDFHAIDPKHRTGSLTNVRSEDIVIGDDVFIGSNAIILKGVNVPRGSVIPAGTTVRKGYFE
jgi:acetyltransferase-like isoleucine patch superfamily enzyme